MKHTKRIISLVMCIVLSLSLFCVAANAKGDTEITRVSCTMNGSGSTARGFSWFTDSITNSDVQIVKSSDFDGTFQNAKTYSGETEAMLRLRFPHKVTVTDLEKGTEYTYRVGDKEIDLWSKAGTFKTDNEDDCFSFITIADIQADNEDDFKLSADVLKKAVEICPDSEFTVNLGDFVDDDTNDEWDWFFESFEFNNLSTTLVPVAGNHDGNITNKLNINVFNSMFNVKAQNTSSKTNWINGVYYSFDYGNAHFAVLNTNDMYPMLQSQRNWLVNDMKSSDRDWKIVLMHRALYSEGKNINKPFEIQMRDILIPLFDELDIDFVYAGHDHCYYRSYQLQNDEKVNNVTYVTESYNNEETVFAVNPEGTCYVLPSSAGQKRYDFYDAINPISENCAFHLSTKNQGGVFTTTEINGDRFVMKAYIVDDTTKEATLIDSYAIKKDIGQTVKEESSLPTDNFTDMVYSIKNLISSVIYLLKQYFMVLIPQLIKG